MRKFFPLVLVLVVIIFFWKTIFQSLLPIPSDTIIGLYHPFRDIYSKDYPNGIPYKNFLITDPIVQLYPWKFLTISLEKEFQLPLWNPYNFSGIPLLANFQSGSFYPLNIIFFILPFQFAWTILIILQPLLGGLFMYFYLKNLKLHPFASALGALVFSFSGFSVSWLEWGTITQTFMWVPLILLAKDKLLEKWSLRWILIFFFAEVSAFFAGHLQVLFYALIVTNVYLFVRVYQKAKEKKGNVVFNYNRIYLPFLIVGVLMYLVTSIQWGPTLQLILSSARNTDQSYLNTQGWFIPWQNLFQFIAPDIFGNPATLNYFGIWNYAEMVGYIGIIPLIFCFYTFMFRRDKKTMFFSVVLFLALIFSLPTFIAKLPYRLNIPLLSTAQPTRLMSVVDFCLAVLTSLGFDLFIKSKKRIYLAMSIVILGFLFLISILKVNPNLIGASKDNFSISIHNLVFPVGILISAIVVFSFGLFIKNQKLRLILFSILFLITTLDLLRFGFKFTPFTPPSYLYPNTKTTSFLKNNIGNFRFLASDSRIMPPNFSIMYKLQSVGGYDPLFLRNYAQLISASERGKPDIKEPFGFNRIITPHSYNSKIIDLLGVKYVLSLSDIKDKNMKKVFDEGITQVYENKNVIQRAFFISQLQKVKNKEEAINALFEKTFDPKAKAIIEWPAAFLDISQGGSAKIVSYKENSVTILANVKGIQGFLVLTDIYYPTWRAKIDGKETQVLETDLAFRGIFVPKGIHKIEFSVHLF